MSNNLHTQHLEETIARLEAEAQALREELKNRTSECNGLHEMLRQEHDRTEKAREEVAALRARVVVVQEPVTMDGKTTIREHVANAAPVDLPMCPWTQGYEECKRRIHAMFEQPCNKSLNGKAVSEGLLWRVCSEPAPENGVDGVRAWLDDQHAAMEELRTLLNGEPT